MNWIGALKPQRAIRLLGSKSSLNVDEISLTYNSALIHRFYFSDIGNVKNRMKINMLELGKGILFIGNKMNAVFMLIFLIVVQLHLITCTDNGDDYLSEQRMENEITTPNFNYTIRGTKKFGDKCEHTEDCGFMYSVCDPKQRTCQCIEDMPVTNHYNKCGKAAEINDSCTFNEQCEFANFQTQCRDGRCVCRFELTPIINKDGSLECKAIPRESEFHVQPAMIGILVGMALMFIIICVVLRLFSQARWRENRTIFNTPNPRLMNVSLLRESKLLHGQERRGSKVSVRLPSRQPSLASLRPHSPNPSLGSRRGSRGSSNASATSSRSKVNATTNLNNHFHCDNGKTQDNKNIPVIESITVEVIDEK